MKMLQAIHGQRATNELLINTHLNNINTSVLVKIASISSSEPKVTVEVLSKRAYIDENNERQYTQLGNIEVRLAYMKGFKPTTKVGDYGLLIVCQSAIEPFLSGASDSPRKYNILDGIFFFMFYEPSSVNTENVEIDSATGEDIVVNCGKDVDITVQGKFNVTKGSDELVNILAQLANVCAQIVVNTSTGVLEPGIISDFNDIKAKIEAFQ